MRRALKLAAWISSSLVLLMVLMIGAILIAGNTDGGRALIERLTARLSAGHVQLVGLTGSFPATIELRQLQLGDARGIWLNAERVSLRWSPLALLARHVQVESLQMARLHIERRPIIEPTSSSSNSIPRFDVTDLSIDTLELGAELAGAPASLNVRGHVRWRSIQDASADLLARRTDDEGNYALRGQFSPNGMDATLTLQEPASGPLENLLGLPGLGALSVLATLSGPREAERLQISLDAGLLHGRAQGSLNLKQPAADLEYSLQSPAMAPAAGVKWQRIALQGRWRGDFISPVADGRLQVERLQLSGETHIAAVDASLTAAGGRLALRAALEGLVIPGSQPQLLRRTPVTMEASMRLSDATRPLELTLRHALFSLHAQALTAGEPSATIELRLPDVSPVAAYTVQDLRGAANLNARIRRERATTRVDLDASGRLVSAAAWARVLGNSTRLQLSVALTDETLKVERLLLTGRALSLALSGNAALPEDSRSGIAKLLAWRSNTADQLNAQWELKLADLAALSPALAGTLNASGRIGGTSAALTTDADLSSTLSVRGSPRSTLVVAFHARGLPSAPSGTLQAHGDFDGAPLQLDTSLESGAGELLHVQIRRADWKSAHVEGDMVTDAAMKQARGQLQLRLGQLADLQRLVGTSLQGSIVGTLGLRPDAGRTMMQLDLEANDVQAGELKVNAKLNATGPTDALTLQLNAQSPDVRGAPLRVSSTGLLNLSSRELRVATAEALYRNQTLHLLAPARLSFADEVTITGLQLGAQQAILKLDGRVSPALDLHATLEQLRPQLIEAFMPGLVAAGVIAGNAELQGSTAALTGRVNVNASGLRLVSDVGRGLPALDIRASAQLMGNAAQLDARISAGNASQLIVSGRAPLSADGALALKLVGTMDLGLFNPLFEAGGRHVAGELNVNASVAGAVTAPQLSGSLRVSRGNLRDYTQGVNLSDISAQLEGSNGKLRITSFTARPVTGSLSMTGTIGVLEPGLPVDLKLIANDAQPIANNVITANLDADLHVSGTARERLEVAGTIRSNRTTINIPSRLPPNVAVLDVRRPGQAAATPPSTPLVIGLNVAVQAPRQILVRGRGLDAELGGELQLKGTSAAPLVTGGFDLQRGSFTLVSSRLMFTSGRVSFNDTGLKNKIDPMLDFAAETTTGDVTATLKITGLADAPQFELSSSPQLPQDEILARLLFGVNASQLTALQVAQIGAGLATLSGVGRGGLDPLAAVQKRLGLDRLSVAGSGTGSEISGATIEAGRYISSRVYAGAKQNTTGGSQVQVDVDLSKHLKLQTRLGSGTASAQGTTPDNDPGSSVGLTYQFEY